MKNKAQLRIGIIKEQIMGKAGVVRGFKIQLGNGYIVKRPIQLVCDLEIGAIENDGIENARIRNSYCFIQTQGKCEN